MDQGKNSVPLIEACIVIGREKHYLLVINISGNRYTRTNSNTLTGRNCMKARSSWIML